MVRKISIITILVIVLVSLNWFRELMAADLSTISPAERARIQEQWDQAKELEADQESRYQTPDIFGSNEKPGTQLASSQNTPESGSSAGSRTAVLLPFGRELFRGARPDEPPMEVASASDYVLGPGDNLIIYLWGRVEKQYDLTLDREGKLFIPQVGEILGWGLTLEEFSRNAKRSFSKVFSEFELTVSLGKIRSIRVYLTGEVERPGAYTVSSLTSMFDAIYDAGGPNERGSMRNIQLKRQGELVAEIDLYKLLLEGDNSSDIRLKTGDAIFVPVAGPRIAVSGEINRPAIYELKGESTASQILQLAGRPTARARLDRVMLERIGEKREWEIQDLDLSGAETTSEFPLKDGDRLTVHSIFEFERNRIGIFGHVRHPGYYEQSDTTRVSDLIQQGKLQPYDVFMERADLFRRHQDSRTEIIPISLSALFDGDETQDICLREMDSLHIYSNRNVKWEKFVYVEGEVRHPGRYPLYEKMYVSDLIFLAGSLVPQATRQRGEIARLDSLGEVTIRYFSLDENADYLLQENDHVYVRQIPQWQLHPTVAIEGEVRYPGEYMLSARRETLYGLFTRAGGFTDRAFPKGIVVERKSIEQNLERIKINDLIGNTQPVVVDSLGAEKIQTSLVYSATSLNRIIIDTEELLGSKGERGDIVLQPDDRIFVPTVPSGISVLGAVGANGTIKFESNRNVNSYVNRAGGFTRRADKDEARLIRATGEVISGKDALKAKAELGDIVFVPTKIEKEKNWFKNFSTTMSAVTGILTSVYIVSKI
ncbi:MAG: SLBB domain-containing protein [bacterium]|nr:SLBB domain-containing protein [bacterium]